MVALAAGLVATAVPFAANAAAPARNTIALQSYHVDAADTLDGHSIPAALSVSFVNQGNVPATDVVFVVHSPDSADYRLDDKGTFSPGATIRHQFRGWDWNFQADSNVSIAAVTYADGSSWTSQDDQTLLERPQAQRDL
jgi:hypothetical protein